MDFKEKKFEIIISSVLGLVAIMAIVGWRSAANAHYELGELKKALGGQLKTGLADAGTARADMKKALGLDIRAVKNTADSYAEDIASVKTAGDKAAAHADSLHKTAIEALDAKVKELKAQMAKDDADLRQEANTKQKTIEAKILSERKWTENFVIGKLRAAGSFE